MNENTTQKNNKTFLEALKKHLEANQFNVKNEGNNLFIERKFHNGDGAATKYLLLIQVKGIVQLNGNNIKCKLNFIRQLKLIIGSLLFPFILFSILYTESIFLFILIFIITGSMWYIISVSKIQNIIDGRISKRRYVVNYKITLFKKVF